MQIEFEIEEYDEEQIAVLAAVIGGKRYKGEGQREISLPEEAIEDVPLEGFDKRVFIAPAASVHEDLVFVSSVPLSLQRVDDGVARVWFNLSMQRKNWNERLPLEEYQAARKAEITERQSKVGDVQLDSFEDDGDDIRLVYTATLHGKTLGDVVQQAHDIAIQIESATAMALGSDFEPDEAEDERAYTMSVVIPLLRKLGFSNVRYNHGKREFGKDITFARRTEFDDLEQWGAQIKHGDVGGGVSSDVDGLVSQAEDAFRMPYDDPYTKQRVRISKLLVVVSGKFTENAVEKICEKIESFPLKNNVVFLDGEKIETLCERFRRPRS